MLPLQCGPPPWLLLTCQVPPEMSNQCIQLVIIIIIILVVIIIPYGWISFGFTPSGVEVGMLICC